MQFGPLLLAALIWTWLHLSIAGTGTRNVLAARLGEGGFRIAFSVGSVLALIFLILAYQRAPMVLLWVAPDWLRWVLVGVMLIAFLLFVASVTSPNPTAVGGEKALATTPRGIQRITRHPMLWSFGIWAVVHMLGNGDVAALLFFGAFGVTAFAGMPSIDAKLARRDPVLWRNIAASTSILPFGAIAAGRNRLAVAELGWLTPVLAVVAWLVLLYFHSSLFGVSPLPTGV